VTRALELDDQLAEAHVSLALMRHRTEYDWPGAERSFKQALVANPGYAEGLVRYGEWLYLSGRVDQGLALIRQGVGLVPFNVDYRVILGYALYNTRRFDESLTEFREAWALDASRPRGSWGLAQTYAIQRRDDEAVAEYLTSLTLMLIPERAAETDTLRAGYRQGGWDWFWRSELNLAEEDLRQPGTVWRREYNRMQNFELARRYARLGEDERAIESLETSFQNREGNLVCLNVEPLFDKLHNSLRFQELVRRVGAEALMR
jgi:tetratricopeptide (TPR) repeat protein